MATCPFCVHAHTEHLALLANATDEEIGRLNRTAEERSSIARALTEPNRLTGTNMRNLAELAEVFQDNWNIIVDDLRARAKAKATS